MFKTSYRHLTANDHKQWSPPLLSCWNANKSTRSRLFRGSPLIAIVENINPGTYTNINQQQVGNVIRVNVVTRRGKDPCQTAYPGSKRVDCLCRIPVSGKTTSYFNDVPGMLPLG